MAGNHSICVWTCKEADVHRNLCMWQRERGRERECIGVCWCVGGGKGGVGCEWSLLSRAGSCCSVFERQRGCPCMPLTLSIHSLPPSLYPLSPSQFCSCPCFNLRYGSEKKKRGIHDWILNADSWCAGPLIYTIMVTLRAEARQGIKWHRTSPHHLADGCACNLPFI